LGRCCFLLAFCLLSLFLNEFLSIFILPLGNCYYIYSACQTGNINRVFIFGGLIVVDFSLRLQVIQGYTASIKPGWCDTILFCLLRNCGLKV
jgi:hypothetical protein